jgi:carboxy-cis,cis-muconate cyclase
VRGPVPNADFSISIIVNFSVGNGSGVGYVPTEAHTHFIHVTNAAPCNTHKTSYNTDPNMNFIVGTFNTPDLFTFTFNPPSTRTRQAPLVIANKSTAIGNHSWLGLSPKTTGSTDDRFLYATAWTEPPSVAAYSVKSRGQSLTAINSKPVRARSGYVCASKSHVYSCGGPTGEAFAIAPDGGIGDLVQELEFVDPDAEDKPSGALHGDFGGLRHGSHSVDLSPDMRSLYIADIGRNAIFTYSIDNEHVSSGKQHLTLGSKHISPRPNDGPRHTWPHPSGEILYSLQEHTSIVDLFSVADDGVTLAHKYGIRVIPADKDPKDYWADEVRLSTRSNTPRYMYASTRGLAAETKGYVAVFELQVDGNVVSEEPIHIWETPTSGGIANAIEPAPWSQDHGDLEYLAMTDSHEGWVFILSFDGKEVKEAARVSLGKTESGDVVQAATAVWL